jgi:limonene 1,2-monooxygenase
MRFGVFIMPEHYPWDNWTLSYQRDLDQIVLAEKFGFDEYWIGEHHTGGFENIPAPEFIIAKASALTSRINLAPGVINLPYHDPFLVAERLAFLDHLTHGRLIYGFGAGGLPSDWALFNMEGDVMRPRMRESLDIIRQLTEGRDPITYEGEFWRGENRVLQVHPYKDRIPEFGLAGLTGASSFELAAQNGWGALSVMFTPPKFTNNPSFVDLHDHARILDESATAAGRDPIDARRQWRVVREVYVAEDRDTAIKEIRKSFENSYGYLINLGLGALMKLDEAMEDAELTLEWNIQNVKWVIGSPDECVATIKGLYDDLGGFGTFVMNGRDWNTTAKVNNSMELFARYVIPQLAYLEPGKPEGQTVVERRMRQVADPAAV